MVTAPGRDQWSVTVPIAKEGTTTTIAVPELAITGTVAVPEHAPAAATTDTPAPDTAAPDTTASAPTETPPGPQPALPQPAIITTTVTSPADREPATNTPPLAPAVPTTTPAQPKPGAGMCFGFVYSKDGTTKKYCTSDLESCETKRVLIADGPYISDLTACTPAASAADQLVVEHARGRRRLAIGLVISGVVAAGGGVGFGLAAQSSWDSARALCGQDLHTCSPAMSSSVTSKVKSAQVAANVSTVLVAAGVVSGLAGVVLYLLDRGHEEQGPSTGLAITPMIGPSGIGVGLAGSL